MTCPVIGDTEAETWLLTRELRTLLYIQDFQHLEDGYLDTLELEWLVKDTLK